MKSNVMPSIVQLEANELKNLVAEVKETVATGVVSMNSKRIASRFGIADLWNIQRNARRATVNRRSM